MASSKTCLDYDEKIANYYELLETIGEGHFAEVKLARHIFTGENVAAKVITKAKMNDVARSHLHNEVKCLKLLHHPNIVRLYDVIESETRLYIILELGDGGDLFDYIIKQRGGLGEPLTRRYFRQMVEAVTYCHKLHIVHRDLKPENILVFDKLGLVKIIDFGFSNTFGPGKSLCMSCGSLAYSSPEILMGDFYYPPGVDAWSLGVILYMMLVGVTPFQQVNDSETVSMIMDCRYLLPSHISLMCRDFISRMLQVDPNNRTPLPYLLAHPWLEEVGDSNPTPATATAASFRPLVTRETITREERRYAVQKMVEAKLTSRGRILASLRRNAHNHLTTTFYLILERRRREQQLQKYHRLQQQQQQREDRQKQQQQQDTQEQEEQQPSTSGAGRGVPTKPRVIPLMLPGSPVQKPAMMDQDVTSSHYVLSLTFTLTSPY